MNMLEKLKDMARAMLRRGADSAPPRIGSLFALVCAALFAFTASAATHYVGSEAELRALTSSAELPLADGDTIVVTNDFTLSLGYTFTRSVTLTSAPGTTNRITRSGLAKFNIHNTQVNEINVTLESITLDGGVGIGTLFEIRGSRSSLTMNSGAMVTNVVTRYATSAPIYAVGGGAFTMNEGATIVDCTNVYTRPEANPDSSSGGGAIRCGFLGTVLIAGGTIRNCSAEFGGAVIIQGKAPTSFTMTGGTIIDCFARQSGGAIAVFANGVPQTGEAPESNVKISGGRITRCSAPTLLNNKVLEPKGGGIALFSNYLYHGNTSIVYASLTMSGGEISSCTGGGVVTSGSRLDQDSNVLYVSGNTTIVNNEGGNIVVHDASVCLNGAYGGRAGVTYREGWETGSAQFGVYSKGSGAENLFNDLAPTVYGVVSGGQLVWSEVPLKRVELDFDNDGNPDVIITTTDGTIEDNGDGSYDVTGEAEIELVDGNGNQIGVIEVPTNTTVTVGTNGVTTVDAGETVTVVIDNGDGTTTETTVNGPATIGPDGTITVGPGGSTTSVTTDGNGDIVKVELDLDGDGDPDVVITPTGDGDDEGTITDNGNGSYDVTGEAEIELRDADGVIYVPTNTTVTVGGDGVTTVDEDETVTVVTDNGDGTTTETPVEGPATIGPDGTITPTPAGLDGEARITAWWTTNAQWRLTFTVPEAGLSGKVARLMADKSFSVKFARELADINTAGVDAINHTYGYLDFTIDEAKTEGGSIVVTLTITDDRISSGSRMFVKITDPKDR